MLYLLLNWRCTLYTSCSGEGVSSAICAYPADATENNNGVFGVFSRDIIRAGETSDEEVINTFFEVCYMICRVDANIVFGFSRLASKFCAGSSLIST